MSIYLIWLKNLSSGMSISMTYTIHLIPLFTALQRKGGICNSHRNQHKVPNYRINILFYPTRIAAKHKQVTFSFFILKPKTNRVFKPNVILLSLQLKQYPIKTLFCQESKAWF